MGDTYKRATRREALATPPATKGQEAKWSEAGDAAARRRHREAGVQQPRWLHPSGDASQPRESGALPWLWGSDQGPFFPVFFLWATNS